MRHVYQTPLRGYMPVVQGWPNAHLFHVEHTPTGIFLKNNGQTPAGYIVVFIRKETGDQLAAIGNLVRAFRPRLGEKTC